MAIISRKEVPADLKGRSSTEELSQQCHHNSAAKIVEQRSTSAKDKNQFISFDRPVYSGKEIDHIIRGDTMIDSSFPQALPCKNQQGHRASVDGQSRGPSTVCIPGLIHKYQPKVFEDIVGNEMVVKALSNAIQRKRVSPLYLFHGPSGAGKTSTAKIFSIALNCESPSPSKPCWKCTSCSRSLYTAEMCSGNRNSAFENIRTLLEGTTFMQTFPGFKVFIINECHYLAKYSWRELLEMIEEENYGGSLVIILITEDAKAIPKTISSRCQKFAFAKLKDSDIAQKLAMVASHEGIKISKDALKLVAAKADGNLREAEILLDQLALLGQCITTSTVQQLVGLASHDKLSHLLEAALVGNSLETVRCTKDLIACGIEPQDLVSQLASLVMEILAGTSPLATSHDKRKMQTQSQVVTCSLLFSHWTSLAHKLHSVAGDNQPERLCRALKILAETEKQLIMSPCNHTTWATAALLKIASGDSFSGSSSDIILPKDTTLAGMLFILTNHMKDNRFS
ncbi:protein STICHEL-like [Elaeis guineensis]|uniref:protein STICHEL-like n=1 Tax=Elaeis guineensis var. tenera TaxID=51953 RepID=UPI003C6D2882